MRTLMGRVVPSPHLGTVEVGIELLAAAIGEPQRAVG